MELKSKFVQDINNMDFSFENAVKMINESFFIKYLQIDPDNEHLLPLVENTPFHFVPSSYEHEQFIKYLDEKILWVHSILKKDDPDSLLTNERWSNYYDPLTRYSANFYEFIEIKTIALTSLAVKAYDKGESEKAWAIMSEARYHVGLMFAERSSYLLQSFKRRFYTQSHTDTIIITNKNNSIEKHKFEIFQKKQLIDEINSVIETKDSEIQLKDSEIQLKDSEIQKKNSEFKEIYSALDTYRIKEESAKKEKNAVATKAVNTSHTNSKFIKQTFIKILREPLLESDKCENKQKMANWESIEDAIKHTLGYVESECKGKKIHRNIQKKLQTLLNNRKDNTDVFNAFLVHYKNTNFVKSQFNIFLMRQYIHAHNGTPSHKSAISSFLEKNPELKNNIPIISSISEIGTPSFDIHSPSIKVDFYLLKALKTDSDLMRAYKKTSDTINNKNSNLQIIKQPQ